MYVVESVIQNGDSGGGLVYIIRDQFVLYSVISNRIKSDGEYSFYIFMYVIESVIQNGDSGGGLVYIIRDQFVLYGVISNRIKSDGEYSFYIFFLLVALAI